MSVYSDGVINQVAGPIEFEAKVLENTTLPATDRIQLAAFHKKVSELSRAVYGSIESINEILDRLELIKTALIRAENA